MQERETCSYTGCAGGSAWDCTNDAKPEYAELASFTRFRMQSLTRPANHAKPDNYVYNSNNT